MADAFTLAVATSAVSGAALAVLGVPLLVGRPRRTHKTAFGAFLLLWGALILAGNLSRLSALEGDYASAERWIRWTLAPLVCLYLPLVYFASTYPARRGVLARSPLAALALLAPAATGAAALTLAPSLFYQGLAGEPPLVVSVWGPLFFPYTFLFIAALYYTVHALARHHAGASRSLEARRVLYVLLAVVLYVGFFAAETAAFFGGRFALGRAAELAPWQDAALFLLALAGMGLVARVARGLLAGGRVEARGDRRLVAAAALLPLGFGLLSGVSKQLPGVPPIETLGLWRLAAAGLLVYAILRFELFDLDRKVKRGLLAAAAAAGVLALGAGLAQALEGFAAPAVLGVGAAQVVLAASVVAAFLGTPRLSARLSRRVLPRLDAPDHIEARRLEVYEAALAQAVEEGALEARGRFLHDLRGRLGISESEHALLLRLVQAPRAGAPGPGAPPAPGPGALVAGRYRIERPLGEGAFGTAFLARDEALGRPAVLKALRPQRVRSEEAVRAFLREARLAASLQHPHVIRVHDFGSAGDTPYVVADYAEQGSLAQLLARAGPLPPGEARRILGEVLAGLAYVHGRGVLHLDVKPANILLDADGAAKLADFGVARVVEPLETQTGLGEPEVPLGTPAYMSPEAVQGLTPGAASDLYSAGAVLYEALTGITYLPFEGRTAFEVRRAILEDPPRAPPMPVDARLLGIALRALEKDPARRFASATAMQEALLGAAPPTPPAPPRAPSASAAGR